MKRFKEVDFIDALVNSAAEAISNGYYEVKPVALERRSLKAAIDRAATPPIIAEIKFASPSAGIIRRREDVRALARSLERGGAAGLSVLVEGKHFMGRLEYLAEAKGATGLPILMKDIIIDPVQMEAGRRLGADAILLIFTVFRRNYSGYDLGQMIDTAHGLGLEVVLEVHTREEFLLAVNYDADIIGVNNRDLSTLKTSLSTCEGIPASAPVKRTVIAESGISTAGQMLELSKLGYRGFLIGHAIMASADPESKLRSLAALPVQAEDENPRGYEK